MDLLKVTCGSMGKYDLVEYIKWDMKGKWGLCKDEGKLL